MRRNSPLEREDGFQEREVKCQNETHIRPTPLASASETCGGLITPCTHLLTCLPTTWDFLSTRDHRMLEYTYSPCLLLR